MFKPYANLELRNRFNSDSAFHTALNSTAFCENSIFDAIDVEKSNKNWIHRKLLYEHFGIAKGKNYILYIDPLFDFNLAKSFPYNKNIYVNTRAVQVYASFYNKLTISSSIYENQAKFPDFIDDYYNYFGVIPGHERVKPFGSGAYDWANAYASISFKATKFLHFELGNEKNFIGNGYRSMILSDFSPQYFYFKTSAFWKRFFYTNIASRTLNPNYNNISGTRPNWSANDLYPHKMMNINYFGLNINPKIEIGVFEACMMGINSRLNPKLSAWLPAVNELIYSNSDSLNFLWGSNINVNAFKNLNIYAQFAAQINKSFASQLGATYLYESNLGNLFVRAEWNKASKNMYNPIGNENFWGHYNQTLAHPAGSNFNEWLTQIMWQYKRYYAFAQFGQIKYLNGIEARNIFDNSLIINNNSAMVSSASLRLSYLINPAYSWHVFVGVNYWQNSDNTDKFIVPSIGMKTFLRNNYLDF